MSDPQLRRRAPVPSVRSTRFARRGVPLGVVGAVALWLTACTGDGWEEFASQSFGYTIEYPGSWRLLEAGPWHREVKSRAEFLSPGELEKLTFLGPAGGTWSGLFELRVLPNPDGRALDAWLESFRLPNLSFVNMTDTTLAGLPAKRWTRHAYDLTQREIVAVSGDRAFYLSFDANRDENPDFEAHQEIYRRMVESFTLKRE